MDKLAKFIKRSVPWALAFFLIAGQFFACYWGTDRLWPFHPLWVYTNVQDLTEQKSLILVAFRKEHEEDIVSLEWVGEHLERKLAGRVAHAASPEERREVLRLIAGYLSEQAGEYEGLRAYRLTFNFKTGEVTEQKLLAEARWKP